ncbi:hypothetical protein ACH5RR_041785 [Cinchona calisaya]|uniref:Uncharacterized protein n=1 Tax=Cinchona calisaya TaxID=153742 RepID=A0ABD2XZZ7_9GENT
MHPRPLFGSITKANLVHCCVVEYFDHGEKSSDALVQNQLEYKCVLNSKDTEESMASNSMKQHLKDMSQSEFQSHNIGNIWAFVLIEILACIEDIVDVAQELANKAEFKNALDDKPKQNEHKDKSVSEQIEDEKKDEDP